MSGEGAKRLWVGQVSYVLDEDPGTDIAKMVTEIEQALQDGTVVKVPVLDESRNQLTLYLNGGQVDAVVLDLDKGPKPGEISP